MEDETYVDEWTLEGQTNFGGLILALLLGARHSGTWNNILISSQLDVISSYRRVDRLTFCCFTARWLLDRGAQEGRPRPRIQHFLLRNWYVSCLLPLILTTLMI
jgi:hypothetical protein